MAKVPKRISKITPRARGRFLEKLSENGNVAAAARATGIDRTQWYHYANDNPEFKEAWRQALLTARDRLEEEAWRRAVEGIDEPLVYQGQFTRDPETNKPLTVKRYSDRLIELLLKAHHPERYKDRSVMTHGGDVTLHRGLDLSGLSREELREFRALLEKAKEGRR